jgi:hypothetical protein
MTAYRRPCNQPPGNPAPVMGSPVLDPAVVDDHFIDDGSEQPDHQFGVESVAGGKGSILGHLLSFSFRIDRVQGQLLLHFAHSRRHLKATSEYFDKLLIENVDFGSKGV